MKPISISQPLGTALDSSHSYVMWMPHTFSRPLAFILHFQARNWDFCGADSFVLQGLLSFTVMPWDSLRCVCPQLHSQGKSERRAVILYGKLFCGIHEMTLTPLRGRWLPCHLLLFLCAFPSGFLWKQKLSFTTPPEFLSPSSCIQLTCTPSPMGLHAAPLEVTLKTVWWWICTISLLTSEYVLAAWHHRRGEVGRLSSAS